MPEFQRRIVIVIIIITIIIIITGIQMMRYDIQYLYGDIPQWK